MSDSLSWRQVVPLPRLYRQRAYFEKQMSLLLSLSAQQLAEYRGQALI